MSDKFIYTVTSRTAQYHVQATDPPAF